MLVHCFTLAEGTAGTRVNIDLSLSPLAYSPVNRPASVYLGGVLVLPWHVHIQRAHHLNDCGRCLGCEESRKCLLFCTTMSDYR